MKMLTTDELKYFTDGKRHLVCVPFSVDNLHKMAKSLSIPRYWYHGGKLPHYDIPKKRLDEINKKCNIVSSKDIVRIIRDGYKP